MIKICIETVRYLGSILGPPILGPLVLYRLVKYVATSLSGFDKTAKTLGIIGMQESGKTQIYNSLKSLGNNSYEATPTIDYEEFEFSYNGRRMIVKAGRDIGGGDEYISYYEKWMSEKDIMIMVFDARRYKDDHEYHKQVNARLDFIWRKSEKLRKQYDNLDDGKFSSSFLLIGSHYDQFSKAEKKTILKDLQSDVLGKAYENLFHKNFMLLDLTDSKIVKDEIGKMFK